MLGEGTLGEDVPGEDAAGVWDGVLASAGAALGAGMGMGSGMGALTSRLKRGLSTAVSDGVGVWARTTPAGPGAGMWAMVPSSRPRRRMVMVAGRSAWPTRLGMETCWGPRLWVTRTAQARRTVVPDSGDWAMMVPTGTVAE